MLGHNSFKENNIINAVSLVFVSSSITTLPNNYINLLRILCSNSGPVSIQSHEELHYTTRRPSSTAGCPVCANRECGMLGLL